MPLALVLLALLAFGACAPAPAGWSRAEPRASEARAPRASPLPREPAAPREPARPRVTPGGLERLVHDETNRARARQGRAALRWRADLAPVGRRHGQDMAARGYFDHVAPDGRDPTDRAARAGLACRRATARGVRVGFAENLARYGLYRSVRTTRSARGTTRAYDWYTERELARSVVDGWLQSPGHRRNLLDAGYAGQGIGVFITSEGTVYVTQMFC